MFLDIVFDQASLLGALGGGTRGSSGAEIAELVDLGGWHLGD